MGRSGPSDATDMTDMMGMMDLWTHSGTALTLRVMLGKLVASELSSD